jgi:hypothetical protein
VGWVVGSADGQWLVDYPANPHGPLPARRTVHVDARAFARAAHEGAEALLLFEDGRPELPIVVGLLVPAEPDAAPDPGTRAGAEAVADGERLVYTARREIVLRCGKASIQLTSDGAVRIRGTEVLSRASATNRIRGGNVQIN